MSRFEQWTLHVFTCHAVVLRRKWLGKNEIDLTLKFVGMLTVSFPLFVLLFGSVSLLPTDSSSDVVHILLFAVPAIVIFGMSKITDPIYDANKTIILERANEIQVDPDSGTWWAVRFILVTWSAYIAITVLLVYLGGISR